MYRQYVNDILITTNFTPKKKGSTNQSNFPLNFLLRNKKRYESKSTNKTITLS